MAENPKVKIEVSEIADCYVTNPNTNRQTYRKPRTNHHRERNLANILQDGQRVRQKSWIGVFCKQKNKIYHNGIPYQSFNSFATAYYVNERPDRKTKTVNAWIECEVEVDGSWLKLHLLHKDIITPL